MTFLRTSAVHDSILVPKTTLSTVPVRHNVLIGTNTSSNVRHTQTPKSSARIRTHYESRNYLVPSPSGGKELQNWSKFRGSSLRHRCRSAAPSRRLQRTSQTGLNSKARCYRSALASNWPAPVLKVSTIVMSPMSSSASLPLSSNALSLAVTILGLPSTRSTREMLAL
jgi:hypothetical protein